MKKKQKDKKMKTIKSAIECNRISIEGNRIPIEGNRTNPEKM